MPNVPVIKGNNTVLWGTGSAYSTAIVVSARDQLTGEMVEVSDNVGFTISAIFFNDKHECEVEIIIETAAPTLARGDQVTMCGNANCLVMEAEIMWEQKGVRKYRLKATKFNGMTLA